MRRFKLLKDLPDCKAGEIGEDDQSGNVNWRTILSKPDFSRARYLSYPLAFVEARRDWFEEVKDEESSRAYCNNPKHPAMAHIILPDCYTSEPVKKLGKIEPFQEDEGYCQTDIIDKINELVDAVNSLQRT